MIIAMRRLPMLVVTAGAALVAGFVAGLRGEWFPLGVPGEWTWSRLPAGVAMTALDGIVGLLAVGAYAAFVGIGARMLSGRAGRLCESVWLVLLALAAVAVQLGVQLAAPAGFGLTKWTFALHSSGSNGYYTIARDQMDDPLQFWAAYPKWITTQDALHIGTHPPGLFLGWRALLSLYRSNPNLTRAIVANLPEPVVAGFREISRFDPLPPADRAALATVGALTLLACALTVVPLYLLARTRFPAPTAWASAAFWPLVPSAILFQPTADAAFPLLATSALALAARGHRWSSLLAGIVLAVGMLFTLAFLAVGLIVALILAATPGAGRWRRVELIGWTGAGFLLPTFALWIFSTANPFVIWWWNGRNHARFYAEFHRTYAAWMVANPLEMAIALGLPATLWALIGLPRAGRASWATLAVLVVLQLSGRNLSEVARIWLLFMPPLLIATAVGIERCGGRPLTTAMTAGLVGLQTLALQATIQVVYAIA